MMMRPTRKARSNVAALQISFSSSANAPSCAGARLTPAISLLTSGCLVKSFLPSLRCDVATLRFDANISRGRLSSEKDFPPVS